MNTTANKYIMQNYDRMQSVLASISLLVHEETEPIEVDNPCLEYGGNYDDTYSGGYDNGRRQLAKEIKDLMRTEGWGGGIGETPKT